MFVWRAPLANMLDRQLSMTASTAWRAIILLKELLLLSVCGQLLLLQPLESVGAEEGSEVDGLVQVQHLALL